MFIVLSLLVTLVVLGLAYLTEICILVMISLYFSAIMFLFVLSLNMSNLESELLLSVKQFDLVGLFFSLVSFVSDIVVRFLCSRRKFAA